RWEMLMKYICGLSLALLGISPLLIAGDYPGRNIVTPGTRVEVRTNSPVIVAQWDRGRIYPAHVVRDVFSTQGEVMIPRGADCEMIVRELGPGQLALDLESITVAGRRYVMEASGPQF